MPGITRDSILTLARLDGLSVNEKPYSFDALRTDAASGKLREAFACGTAAVVSAIGDVNTSAGQIMIGDATAHPVTRSLKSKLVGIQRGEMPDAHGWIRKVL